jgi:hypothetical protein
MQCIKVKSYFIKSTIMLGPWTVGEKRTAGVGGRSPSSKKKLFFDFFWGEGAGGVRDLNSGLREGKRRLSWS